MSKLLLGFLAAALVSLAFNVPAEAGSDRLKRVARPDAVRDCTPINGRFGYYGNPWCDTGSYRQEDIEFRQRKAKSRRLSAQSEN